MKFVKHHRTQVLALLEKNKIALSDIDFVKRRGRICICYRPSDSDFSYLRKKETKLDPFTRHWKNSEWFKVKSGQSKEMRVDNWDQVMLQFENWLKEL